MVPDVRAPAGVTEEQTVCQEPFCLRTDGITCADNECDAKAGIFEAAAPRQPVETEAWTEERLREAAKRRGWHVRESASVPDLKDGGWKHPFSITASSCELLELLTAVTHPAPVGPAPAEVKADYFSGLVDKARGAAAKASVKFPQPNYVTLKIAEEAGEVVRGAVHYAEGRMDWSEVEGEIVQLLAMLIRFVTEGDQVNGARPPALAKADKPEGE